MQISTVDPVLTATLQHISDVLTAAEIRHVMHVEEENPRCYSVGSFVDGRINFGFVGISKDGKLSFVAHDNRRANHDKAEGIPDDESKCWYGVPTVDLMLCFLDGTINEIEMAAMKLGGIEAVLGGTMNE